MTTSPSRSRSTSSSPVCALSFGEHRARARSSASQICVLAGAAPVALASVVSSSAVSNRLHDQTDNSLRADATRLAKLPNPEIALPYFNLPTPSARDYLRVTAADGTSKIPPNQPIAIPLRRIDVAIARGDVRFGFRDAVVSGRHLRIASATAPDGKSVQFATNVDDVDATISDLRTTLLIVGGFRICGAALLPPFVPRASPPPGPPRTAAARPVATP